LVLGLPKGDSSRNFLEPVLKGNIDANLYFTGLYQKKLQWNYSNLCVLWLFLSPPTLEKKPPLFLVLLLGPATWLSLLFLVSAAVLRLLLLVPAAVLILLLLANCQIAAAVLSSYFNLTCQYGELKHMLQSKINWSICQW
jgi:hypothetical protein